jgi:hypothetical protein
LDIKSLFACVSGTYFGKHMHGMMITRLSRKDETDR